MRLIDADALFEALVTGDIRETHQFCYPCRKVLEAIDAQPTVDPQPEWIPVSERLPDEWKRVLIQNDEGLFLVGFVKDSGWGKEWFYQYEMYDYDAYIESEQGKIVAWMPLPEPYEEQST